MTNWWVVAIGFGVVAFGAALYRFADPVSAAYRRLGKAMRYPDAMVQHFTSGFIRIGGIAFTVMGVIWVFSGLFLADKM